MWERCVWKVAENSATRAIFSSLIRTVNCFDRRGNKQIQHCCASVTYPPMHFLLIYLFCQVLTGSNQSNNIHVIRDQWRLPSRYCQYSKQKVADKIWKVRISKIAWYTLNRLWTVPSKIILSLIIPSITRACVFWRYWRSNSYEYCNETEGRNSILSSWRNFLRKNRIAATKKLRSWCMHHLV